MRTLVLGGTKFIGLHLVRELLRRGHEVTVLNRGQSPAELPAQVRRLYADRGDPEAVQQALRDAEFDAAFDLSAYSVQSLAPAVEALGGRVGRYVFCSTVGVYTPSDTFPITEAQPLAGASSMPLALSAQYALNKAACEEYLRQRWQASGFPFTVVRPCIVYGPDNYIYQWEVSFFARLRRGRPVLIPGDGSRLLHFVHVDDVAQAFASAPETGSSLGQGYTAAGPEAITSLGFVKLLAEIAGVEPKVVFVPWEVLDEAGAPSSFGYVWRSNVLFGIEKARAHLGFQPRPLAAGMAEAYRWYLAQGLDDRPWDFSAEDRLLEGLRA